jgi:hypothetical protein
MLERMANMTPEERQQMIERMKARGITLPSNGQPAAAVTAQRGQAPGQGGQRRSTQAAAATPTKAAGATTIDALFGPLPPTESFGQVWLHENGKLSRVRLRLGIADGQQTELIQVLDNNAKVDEDMDVVTSVTLPAQRAAAAAGGNAFPGLGQQRGGGGFGGPQGGGNRGGGGGRGGR